MNQTYRLKHYIDLTFRCTGKAIRKFIQMYIHKYICSFYLLLLVVLLVGLRTSLAISFSLARIFLLQWWVFINFYRSGLPWSRFLKIYECSGMNTNVCVYVLEITFHQRVNGKATTATRLNIREKHNINSFTHTHIHANAKSNRECYEQNKGNTMLRFTDVPKGRNGKTNKFTYLRTANANEKQKTSLMLSFFT